MAIVAPPSHLEPAKAGFEGLPPAIAFDLLSNPTFPPRTQLRLISMTSTPKSKPTSWPTSFRGTRVNSCRWMRLFALPVPPPPTIPSP